MSQTVRILHLEDNPRDAELVKALLETDGLSCEIRLIQSQDELLAVLEAERFDLVLSDFSLPSYDGRSALLSTRKKHPDIPYIFFSGTIGEEAAIEALRDGATDYVLKQRPTRLVAAVRRALNEAKERAERKRAQQDLKKTEAQLLQAQKLEGVGLLAGGMAHDFNNLLTVINGYCDLTLQSMPSAHPLRANVEQIREAGRRAASLTQQILAFSKQQTMMPVIFNMNDAVANTLKLLRRLIEEHISLVASPVSEALYVKADQGQIEQVIMNLVVNARDAMRESGTVTIATYGEEVAPSVAEKRGIAPGRYVKLMVTDTGCGMDAATQERIFEPFFTTKEPGKGTGLGLSTVYGIVTQSGGSIEVSSQIGQGSAFSVYLPRTMPESSAPTLDAIPQGLPKGTETILLVEDEDMVRSLARHVLRAHGYAVLDARHGPKALEVSGKYTKTIHALVTDMVMPNFNGVTLAREIVSRRPDIKILFMSGYAEVPAELDEQFAVNAMFLKKPFTPVSLLQTLRRLLDVPRGQL